MRSTRFPFSHGALADHGRGCVWRVCVTLALMVWWPASAAPAQSPVIGFGAMQPAKGHFYTHVMPFYRQFDANESTQNRDVRQVSIAAQVSYALLSNVSITLDVPFYFNHLDPSATATGDSSAGFGDMSLLAKWRFWQHDTGPTDTLRLALIGGLQIPGGTTSYLDSTEEGWNPLLGAVFSVVQGRHGGNASVLWELNTEGGDQPDGGLRSDLSYLFRLAPESYGEETSHAAWYLVAELNGLYETNGNHQLFISPGLMYEATWYTLDVSIMLPLVQELKDRPDLEIAVGVGLRLTF